MHRVATCGIHLGRDGASLFKKDRIKPWQTKSWCVPSIDTEYVYRMEDILDLYEEAHEDQRPVVCFDEKPYQLLGHVFQPIAATPGHTRKEDHEYVRHGTCNIFVMVSPKAGERYVKVTERRTKSDFAYCIRDLVDIHFPRAEQIRLVMDNLSTHKLSSLYEAFSPHEARRIIKKLEVHYTPKHASWLNMAEIEISALTQQCLRRP